MTYLELASEAIRDSGGRMTPQRRLIIEVLEQSREHLDVEALYQRTHAFDESVSLATVYRTLNVLEEAGLVQQRYLSRDHDRKYYEPLHAEEEYHITCRNCRTVIPFKSDLILELKKHLAEELHVTDLHACICMDGLCADCAAKLQG